MVYLRREMDNKVQIVIAKNWEKRQIKLCQRISLCIQGLYSVISIRFPAMEASLVPSLAMIFKNYLSSLLRTNL